MKQTIFLVIICLVGFGNLASGQDEKTKPIMLGVLNDKAKVLPMPKISVLDEVHISGTWIVQVKIDLQKGEVVEANAISGHALLRMSAEKAARQTTFEPILKEFSTIYGVGFLIYKLEDFNGKTIESKNPKPVLPILKNGILCGKAISLPKPVYPQEAKDFCAGGQVQVKVLVNEKGEVMEAEAISGDELLREAAVAAAKKARYSPTGQPPVKTEGVLVYNFVSEKKCVMVGIVNQRAIYLPKPVVGSIIHPDHLRLNQDEMVQVAILVDEEGKVISAKAVSGHILLRQAVENAALKTKFSPTPHIGGIKIKAFLLYQIKPDGTVETNFGKNNKTLMGVPINMVKPPFISCTCSFGSDPTVLVQTEIDELGNVTKVTAISGHQILKKASEKAALESKFWPVNLKTKVIIAYKFVEVDKWSVKLEDIEIKDVVRQEK